MYVFIMFRGHYVFVYRSPTSLCSSSRLWGRWYIVDHVRSGVKRVSDDSPLSLRLAKPWRSGSDNLRAGPSVDNGGHCFSPSTTHCYVYIILSRWAAQAEEWLDIANFLHFQIPSVFTLGQQSRIMCKLSYFYLTRTWKFLIWPV